MYTAIRFVSRATRLAIAVIAILALTFLLHIMIPVNASSAASIYLITVLLIAASWGLSEAVAASITLHHRDVVGVALRRMNRELQTSAESGVISDVTEELKRRG